MARRLILAAALLSIVVALPSIALAQRTARMAQQAGPAFVFPANGQTFPYRGPYLFQVQSMSGAMGYLWTFSQNGVIVWQNLDATGSLSGATMSVKGGAPAQRHMHPGALQVRVRAEMKGGSWTNVSSVTVQLQGHGASQHPRPTPKPAPTSAPQIRPGEVLYTADLNKLNGGAEWKHTGGMLVNDGTADSTLLLPFKSPVADYAVEADVQILNGSAEVGLRTRMNGSSGGVYGFVENSRAFLTYDTGLSQSTITTVDYSTDNNWHTYRLEARGNNFRLLVDGTPLIDTQDNHFLSGVQAGLYDSNTQINVRSIRVIAL